MTDLTEWVFTQLRASAMALVTAPILEPGSHHGQARDNQTALGDKHVAVEATDNTLADLFPHPVQTVASARTPDGEALSPDNMIEGQNVGVGLSTEYARMHHLVPVDSVPNDLPVVPTPLVVRLAMVVLPVGHFPPPMAIIP